MRVRAKCYLICVFFFLFLAGAVCYPTCIVALDMDLRDPVVLPNGTTADSLKHWMLPTKVQVRHLRNQVKVCFFSNDSIEVHLKSVLFCCVPSLNKY